MHVLHGFLGKPADWNLLDLKNEVEREICTPNLFEDLPIAPFAEWAKTYHAKFCERDSHHVLMGYSLGGRIGLHLLLQDPKLWKAAIFISTHSGLTSIEDRQARIIADRRWAEKFEKEPWETLLKDWNSQDVFKRDTFSLDRLEGDYCRKALSKALSAWSLGEQEDLKDHLYSLDIPILWMVGAEDTKFLHKARELKLKHPKSKVCVLENAAHRLPWQQPENFLLNVKQFLQSLE